MYAKRPNAALGGARLIDHVRDCLGLPTDSALAYAIDMTPCDVSRVRRNIAPVSYRLLVRMHDATCIPLNELRTIAGLPTVAPYQRK